MIHLKKMHDPELEESRLDSRPAFEGRMLKVFVDTAKLPNGRTSTRELVRHPGAAAVVAVLPDGRVLLERQYRYAMGTVMYEVPAGKLDPGEDPEHCARRELSEETGYKADHWEYLTTIATTPGFTDEVIHLYLATGLHRFAQHLDPDEVIKMDALTPEEIRKAVADGTLYDAKSLAALGFLALLKKF